MQQAFIQFTIPNLTSHLSCTHYGLRADCVAFWWFWGWGLRIWLQCGSVQSQAWGQGHGKVVLSHGWADWQIRISILSLPLADKWRHFLQERRHVSLRLRARPGVSCKKSPARLMTQLTSSTRPLCCSAIPCSQWRNWIPTLSSSTKVYRQTRLCLWVGDPNSFYFLSFFFFFLFYTFRYTVLKHVEQMVCRLLNFFICALIGSRLEGWGSWSCLVRFKLNIGLLTGLTVLMRLFLKMPQKDPIGQEAWVLDWAAAHLRLRGWPRSTPGNPALQISSALIACLCSHP